MTTEQQVQLNKKGKPRKSTRTIAPQRPYKAGAPKSCNWDDPAIQDLAMHSYSLGMTLGEVCKLCKSSDDSLYRWLKTNPDFSRKLDEARAKRKTHAINSSYTRAFPTDKEKKGDTPMAIFLMRTLYGMKDGNDTVVQIANVSQDAKPKEMLNLVRAIPTMSDEELMRLAGASASLMPAQQQEDLAIEQPTNY
jgi:hypothetical protein